MAIVTANLVNHQPVRSARLAQYFVTQKLDTAGASAPDGISPAIDGMTWTHTGGDGDLICTFAEDKKPYAIHFAKAEVVNDITLDCQFESYDLATGVLTFTIVTRSTGLEAANPDNKEVRILLVCTRSDKS